MNELDSSITEDMGNGSGYHPFASVYETSQSEYEDITGMSDDRRADLVETLKDGIEKIRHGKTLDNPETLLDTMLILGHLKEPSAFPWLLALADVDPIDFDDLFGEYFLHEDWPRLLVATAHGKWDEIEKRIRQPEFDEHVPALLQATASMVFDDQVPRERVVLFFQNHFNDVIKGHMASEEHLAKWVNAASKLWPGECLEEIKELYGMDLIDTQYIDIDSVLIDFNKGIEECFGSQHKKYKHAPFVIISDEEQKRQEKICKEKASQTMLKVLKKLRSIDESEFQPTDEPAMSRIGRNDPCPCGSGNKFKKCCLNSKPEGKMKVRLENFKISWDAIDTPLRTEEDQEFMETTFWKMKTEPQSCIEPLIEMIEKYPDDPAPYNYLYACYRILGKNFEAHEILLKTLELFPDYLFAQVEYAAYLLRRGDYEKVPGLFKNCYTLKQLYPERDVFHISEVMAFYFIFGEYYLKIGNIDQAKIYLSMLEDVDSDREQTKVLREEIVTHCKQKHLNKLITQEKSHV
jgi:tetratricopeptide (TPR) repeat protein